MCFVLFIIYCYIFDSIGYDQIPLSIPMDIGSPLDAMDVTGTEPDLHFDQLPAPPQDNNQVAAWYDTDL